MPPQLCQIVLYVENMERALAFYREFLGVQTLYQSPGWSTFRSGGVVVGLHDGRRLDGGHPHANAVPAFRVDNLKTAVERVKELGGRFRFEEHAAGNGDAYAAFADPDGNEVMLVGPAART